MGEAVELMAHSPFDVIVSDIRMPAGNGLEMLRAAHRIDADIPVILMTGAPSLDSAVEALDSGAVRYLTKPVQTSELENAVERAIAGFRVAQHRREAFASSSHLVEETTLLSQLFDRALEKLWMAYQPIISWSRKEVFSLEALVRSSEPALSSPAELVHAAERLNRLQRLGRVIRADVANRLESADPRPLIFVNLHPDDLLDEELYSPQAPLSAFASRVILEITERAKLDQVEGLPVRIARLRLMGFRIAIDDLGSGYSGLSSIVQLHPEIVKLDMSLVRGVESDPMKQKLVRSLIGVCTDLGIQVVAEGIETAAERDALVDAGCDLLQGFFFARPAREFPAVSYGAIGLAS